MQFNKKNKQIKMNLLNLSELKNKKSTTLKVHALYLRLVY